MVSRQQAAGGCAEAGAKVGVRYFFANCVVFTPAGCGWRLSGRTLIAPHPFPILMSAPQPQPSTSLYNVYHIYSIHISTISTLATTTLYCFYYTVYCIVLEFYPTYIIYINVANAGTTYIFT